MRLDTFPAGGSNRREPEHSKVGELLARVWRPREPGGTENPIRASASNLPGWGLEHWALSKAISDVVWKEVNSAEAGGMGAFLVCFTPI